MLDDAFVGALCPGDRLALEALGRRRSYSSGQVLFSEGDAGHDVVVLVDGSVKIVTAARSGREVILDVIDGPALLGELSVIDAQPRSATAITVTPVQVRIVPAADFVTFLEQHGSAATALVRLVAGRLRRTSRRQLEFGTSDALGRLCGCLLRLHDQSGQNEHGSPVTVRLAQHEIAAMTGLSREAVVKGLRAIRTLGWIDLRARELVVLDEAAMRARADG